MAYEAKKDWKYDDIVTESDLNRIEEGIENVSDQAEEHEHRITVVEEQIASQSTKVTELKKRYTLTEAVTEVPIGIPEFHRLTDSLTVIKNSIVLTEHDQYIISEDNLFIIGEWEGSEESPIYFEFKVLKNFVSDLVYFDGAIIQDGTIAKSKLKQDVQDQLDKIDNIVLDAKNVTLDSPGFESTNVKDGMEELYQNVDEHLADNVRHTTQEEKDSWNTHIADNVKHGTYITATPFPSNTTVLEWANSQVSNASIMVVGNRPADLPVSAEGHLQLVRGNGGRHLVSFSRYNQNNRKEIYYREIFNNNWLTGWVDYTNFIRTDSTKKLRAEVSSSAPSSPSNGDIWYDSANHRFRGRANGAWV